MTDKSLVGVEAPTPEKADAIRAALRYWQTRKLAVDAARPDFTREQMRELNAAESRLLAIDVGVDAQEKPE